MIFISLSNYIFKGGGLKEFNFIIYFYHDLQIFWALDLFLDKIKRRLGSFSRPVGSNFEDLKLSVWTLEGEIDGKDPFFENLSTL